MRFADFLETLHAYDNPDWDTKFQPLKKDDDVRVFHGFNSFRDAYRAAIYGLTGRERADRRYSYESDNNPHGLFVTLSLKKAAEFTGSFQDQVIMEFVTKESNLEAPVWPGGGYTVQGEKEQYFGRGTQGKIKRNQRRKNAQGETEDFLKKHPGSFHHIRQSDDKHKANMLLNSTEHQALFIGDLNPKNIAAFHIGAKNKRYEDAGYTRLTREEFLQKYKDYQDKPEKETDYNWPRPPENRIFQPAEEFNGDKFLQGIGKYYTDQSPDELLKQVWGIVMHSKKDKKHSFMDSFKRFLWPKQYAKAMWFMKNRYGKGEQW
jgi:hypothetical protein